MNHYPHAKPVLSSLVVALSLPALVQAGEGGFIEDSTATLTARNYYFSRDYSDIVGPNQQSKAEEWAQGFILNFKSGYTPGPVGVGVDAVGLLGLKLDSSRDRVNTGLLPVTDEGRAADDYSRLGAAVKVKVSKTELKIGEQQLVLPVLYFGDIRLLPPTYQGASLVSNEIAGLTLQGGQLRSTSLRNEAGDEELGAMVGFVPRFQAGQLITSDRFNYAGADYAFNANRTSVGAWYAQLEDLYNQRYFSLKHSEPVGDWVLGASLGYFDSAEDGEQLLGSGFLTEGTLAAQGSAASGVLTTLHYADSLDSEQNRSFREAYRQQFGKEADIYAVQGYDTGLLLAQSLQQVAGNTADRAAWLAAMSQARIASPRGEWTFSKAHNPVQNIYLREVRNGTNVVVSTAAAALADPAPGCKLQ